MDTDAMMRAVAKLVRETDRVKKVQARMILGFGLIDVTDDEGNLHLFTIHNGTPMPTTLEDASEANLPTVDGEEVTVRNLARLKANREYGKNQLRYNP